MSNQPAKSSDRKRSGSGPNPQASQGEGGAAFPRATTFTRAFTLDGSAFTQFGRSVTDTIGLTYEVCVAFLNVDPTEVDVGAD